jgi:hypothetical protein
LLEPAAGEAAARRPAYACRGREEEGIGKQRKEDEIRKQEQPMGGSFKNN